MSENSLLKNIKIPGETIRLPSMGLFYTDGELIENNNGEVHVHPMSAIDEIVMRNVDKLLNGDSIVEVFQRCIPNVSRPGDLYAKDVDILLLVLRKVTYGNQVEALYTHNCEKAVQHTYTTDVGQFITNARNIDPTRIKENYQLVVDSGQVVELRPIRFKDIIKLMQETSMNANMTTFDLQRSIIDSTINVIYSVDGVTDRDQIAEWARTIPTTWFRKISVAIDESSDWGPSTEFDDICQDCGAPIKVEVPLNPLTFFL